MKLKSLMLGAAAAATATTAQAADLPVAPEPVEYVRVCDAYGNGFYYLPGTETCLRVGGRLRTQYVVNNVLDGGNWGTRDSDGTSWATTGYLYLDARTATEYGLLIAFVTLQTSNTNGTSAVGFGANYIQWGNILAGRNTSNFDFFTGYTTIGAVNRNFSDTSANQLAYTFAFGNGFYANLAVEDRSHREVGTYGGTRMPEFVAALGVSQGWGSAQVMGALHQVYPDAANNNNVAKDDLGWAVGGGVKIKLPFANSGSEIAFQGVYADGALAYLDASSTMGGAAVADYATGTSTSTSKGYALGAGLKIQATPTITLALDGSYIDIDQPTGGADVTRYAVDGSVQWEPVHGFIIAGDVGYGNTDPSNASDVDELAFGVRMQRTW